MDSLTASAARLLAAGDPLGALKRVALRDDPPALALRGIAMAQLGDYERARKLLRRAARGFGARERLAQARCQVAEAEVALAARDLSWPARGLDAAEQALAALGDRANALHARLVGRAGSSSSASSKPPSKCSPQSTSPPPMRRRRSQPGPSSPAPSSRSAASGLGRPRSLSTALTLPPSPPASRLWSPRSPGATRPVGAVGAPRQSRRGSPGPPRRSRGSVHLRRPHRRCLPRAVRGPARSVSLAGRPVLFALVGALAEAWPVDVPRNRLIERVFGARTVNESHRGRLRVELGRLRAALRSLARIEATPRGFALAPIDAPAVVVLAPPIDGPAGSVLALLEGGESWSTSALARALGSSQRTVQRVLRGLEEATAVRAVGRGRSRRWLAPTLGGFATNLLLPGALPIE